MALVAVYRELTEEADSRHDSAIRTVWNFLNGSIEFLKTCAPDRTTDIQRFNQLRDRLLPEGLIFARQAYLKEAGNAENLKAQPGRPERHAQGDGRRMSCGALRTR